jgi:thioredoxin 1
MVKEITSESEFKQLVLEECKPVIVDWYAPWCGPCKKIAPVLDELADTYQNVYFYKVNVDALKQLSDEYEVSALPCFSLFISGEIEQEIVGARVELLKEMAKKHN